MSRDESMGKKEEREPAPNESPFELPPVEGMPFDADSEEARAIERLLQWADHERAETPTSSS